MPDQLQLFAEEDEPHGFRLIPAFVNAQEEDALIEHIRELPLAPFQFGAFEGKRRVASFGLRYDYSLQRLEETVGPPGVVAAFRAPHRRTFPTAKRCHSAVSLHRI